MNPLFAFDGVRHMPAEALQPPLAVCPLCGGRNRRPVCCIQRDPDVTLMHCHTCHGASVSRMPVPAALAAFYAGFYHDAADEHVTFGNVDRFGRHLCRFFNDLAARASLRILDFGGGDGAIAASLGAHLARVGATRVEVLVVDYDAGLAPPRHPHVTLTRTDTLKTVAPQSMDIVLASGVLEHVPDPMTTARGLLARLNTGGGFYARTPHVLPYMRLSGTKAVDWFFPYPAHLHDLGQRFWTYAFAHVLEDSACRLSASRPAIVQASFAQYWKIALASHAMKAPWYVLGRHYPFVGGWEVVARRD